MALTQFLPMDSYYHGILAATGPRLAHINVKANVLLPATHSLLQTLAFTFI